MVIALLFAVSTALAGVCEDRVSELRSNLDDHMAAVAPLEQRHQALWVDGVNLQQRMSVVRAKYAPVEAEWVALRSRHGYVLAQLVGMESELASLGSTPPVSPLDAHARAQRAQVLHFNLLRARAELAQLQLRGMFLSDMLAPAWQEANSIHLALATRSSDFHRLSLDLAQEHRTMEAIRSELASFGSPESTLKCRQETLNDTKADMQAAQLSLDTLSALKDKSAKLTGELVAIGDELEKVIEHIGLPPGKM